MAPEHNTHITQKHARMHTPALQHMRPSLPPVHRAEVSRAQGSWQGRRACPAPAPAAAVAAIFRDWKGGTDPTPTAMLQSAAVATACRTALVIPHCPNCHPQLPSPTAPTYAFRGGTADNTCAAASKPVGLCWRCLLGWQFRQHVMQGMAKLMAQRAQEERLVHTVRQLPGACLCVTVQPLGLRLAAAATITAAAAFSGVRGCKGGQCHSNEDHWWGLFLGG
eukprot:1159094-Pelagomonas_calceolata.AAC.10